MSDEKAKELIARLLADDRLRSNSHFSARVYSDEPILTTGRQMRNYLPDEYRKMRDISRWVPGEAGRRGRWLTEAELFYEQGRFMEDFEDSCPYSGSFKAYFPTYSAMSDRQLRGYFTWRATVRRGRIEETCQAFAFVYLYEILCGIGVTDPLDGFTKLRSFWQSYRTFEPALDRYVRIWLQDYVVYHGLDPKLLSRERSMEFDRALVRLKSAASALCPKQSPVGKQGRKRERALPVPPRAEAEEELFCAIGALSTYRVDAVHEAGPDRDDLRHVCCAVFARMVEYYQRNRKAGLIETFFGEETETSHTMFASAVFFDPERHADCEYVLDDIHRYRCRSGFWTCTRVHGSRQKSERLGQIMRATDQRLRKATGSPHPLEEEIVPKYLEKIIDREIEEWLSLKEVLRPRTIEIDLGALSRIRSAAEGTREALLIDEERTGVAPTETAEERNAGTDSLAVDALRDRDVDGDKAPAAGTPASTPGAAFTNEGGVLAEDGRSTGVEAAEAALMQRLHGADGRALAAGTGAGVGPDLAAVAPAETTPTPAGRSKTVEGAAAPPGKTGLLDAAHTAYLAALLADDEAGAAQALAASGQSEDMLVDGINEALFDLVGDTVLEFGAAGPQIIEDYVDDVKGSLNHE